MRILPLLALIAFNTVVAQNWRSIPEMDTYERAAYGQFVIDPNTNNMWLNAEDQVTVIENDGDIHVFTPLSGEISNLQMWNNLRFTFTPNSTYFAMPSTGLYSFDNYSEQLEYNLVSTQDFLTGISSNEDTVYLGFDPNPFTTAYSYVMWTPSSTIVTEKVRDKIIAKGNQKYGINGDTFLRYSDGHGLTDLSYYLIHFNPASADPDYIGGDMNDLKFQRLGDTLFVGGELGISLIYDYDLLPINFTPSNTTNMPSENVLEIEFDDTDQLWAVFGDSQNEAFAIARLDGTNWVDIYDANNSPIDFTSFYGLEIDTAGNLWINDEDFLHTIENPNSPAWLSTIELENSDFSIFPNPTEGTINITFSNETDFDIVQLIDLNGRLIESYDADSQITLGVDSGAYLIRIMRKQEILGTRKLIVK
jgi:hypothetical protein